MKVVKNKQTNEFGPENYSCLSHTTWSCLTQTIYKANHLYRKLRQAD